MLTQILCVTYFFLMKNLAILHQPIYDLAKRIKKIEKLQQRVQFISDVYFRMVHFSNYCSDFHFSSGCKKSVSTKNLQTNFEITCYHMKKRLMKRNLSFLFFVFQILVFFFNFINMQQKNIYQKTIKKMC